MNDRTYTGRLAAQVLERAADVSPVVVLMGARQTGKSTLVRSEPFLSGHRYLTLDDLDIAERAARSPDELLRSAPRLVLDEIQREPTLIHAIKRAVDEDRTRTPGRFVLTGSANLLLMQRVSETLAGRATYLTLWPMTRREKLGLRRAGLWSELLQASTGEWLELVTAERSPGVDWKSEVLAGGYPTPALALHTPEQRTIWFDGYVRTYLERDLQELAAIDNLLDFRRLMKAAALRIGGLLNQAELGRDIAVPRPTVHRYLNLLETSFQVIRLQPYSVNRTKRLIKSARLFWSDTALAMHLGGDVEARGSHLENLVLTDLLVWRDSQIPRPEILYWRTTTDLEVDFVVEHKDKLLAIEVKATPKPVRADARSLIAFRDEYGPQVHGGLLLHGGQETEWLGDGVLAVPWYQVV
ncbi:MAG: ATP-binding protein [Thermoanaerobaculia bacterium]